MREFRESQIITRCLNKSKQCAWRASQSHIHTFYSGFYYDKIEKQKKFLHFHLTFGIRFDCIYYFLLPRTRTERERDIRVHGIDMVNDTWSGFSSALIIERIFFIMNSPLNSFEYESIQFYYIR